MSPTYEVFSLGADAEYDGEWQGVNIVKADAGIGTSLAFTGNASLCHGLDLGLSGSLTASANAAFAMIASASGEARGIASAGISARAVLAPDPFDELGLAIDIGAWAEASAAARLAIGLDSGQILALAGLRVKGLPFELFKAFMDEVRVEAGVWGIASATAKARAHISCSGKLGNGDDSGFTFEMGAAAGLGLGAGWDFFGGAHIEDPGRMMATAARLVSAEIVAEARKRLGTDAQVAVEMLDLALPVILRCCHELGAAAAAGPAGGRSRLLETFISVTEDELRAWAMRRLTAVAEKLVADAVEFLIEALTAIEIGDEERDALKVKIQAAREAIPDTGFTLETAVALAGPLMEAADLLMPGEVSAVRGPLTVLWLSLASASALWDRESYGEEGVDVALPAPPQPVIDELTASGGRLPQTLRVSDAIGYIADTAILPTLADYLPAVGEVLAVLDDALGVGADEIAELILRGASGGSLATTTVYAKLRELLASVIQRLLDEDLLPQLASKLPNNDTRTHYVADVARPAMLAFTRLLLEELDDVAAGNTSGAFDGTFQTALGTLTAKLIGGSAVVLGDVIFDHTLTGIQDGLADLHERVASGQVNAMVDALASSVTGSPLVPPATTPSRQAVTRLAVDLIEAARAGSGPLVWTNKRRNDLRRLLLESFADFDGPNSDADRSELSAFFTSVLDCNFIPHPQELIDAGTLFAEIGADLAVRTIPRTLEALERFTLTLTISVVEYIDRAAREFFDELGETIDDLIRRINELRGQIDAALAAAEQAVRDALNLTGSIANRLRDPSFRTSILAQARAGAIDDAIAVARSVPGFTALPQDVQNAAIGAAIAAFDIAWNAAKPLMDLAIKVAAEAVAGAVAAVLRAADSSQNALDTLRGNLTDAINQELADRGVILPNLTGAALAQIAKDLLLTDELLDILEHAQVFLDQEHAKRQAAEELEAERLSQQDELATEQGRNRIADIRDLSISILSPLPFDPKPETAWKYGSRVPVSIRVHNGFLAMLDEPQRLLLALNGTPVQISATRATSDDGELRIRFNLRAGEHPLIAGINVLECTIIDGRGGTLRQTVAFACDPAVEVLGELEVDEGGSVFDTSDNDHNETEVERVTIFNGSDDDVGLGGWRMMDARRHVFTFPPATLLTGGSITIHTGSGRDTDTDLFWRSPRAIWNNRGDVLQLVDAEGVLQMTYSYGKQAI